MLLALLGARALVPAGFMLVPAAAGAEIRFCGGELHRHAPTAPHALEDPSCPFAQSAGPAPLPTLAPLPQAAPAAATWQPEALSQAPAARGPPRAHAARGPPSAS